jgi:Tfp pilus assembly protein PilE
MGIILGIAVPSVINVIEKSKRNAWNSQKEIIMKALDNYLLLNNDNISWDNNYVYYSIEDLVNIGII